MGVVSLGFLFGFGGGVDGINIPALALGVVVELLLDHANDNVVADETALVHDLLGLPAERCLLGDLGPKHVTCGLKSGGKGCRIS